MHTRFLKGCACCGIKLTALTSVFEVDAVYILHKLNGLRSSDMLIKRTAKIIGYVVLSVGKSAGTAKSTHNRTGFASDTFFDLFPIYGAMAFVELLSGLKHRNLKIRPRLYYFISRIYSAGACPDYYHIIIHLNLPVCPVVTG